MTGSASGSGILTREAYEAEERERLSSLASLSADSRGREKPIEPDPYRTEFQRDRDRIIHCKAFRRLSHKTQVFLAPEGDHYRTRLTHTLEVSQISRSIARALRLNEDLVEAIALGHDLGHTPFGHIGEDALNAALEEFSADYPDLPTPFKHNHQSLRVVEHLEYEGKGLNLTWEVRDGIRHHTGKQRPATLEGQIVALADRIAYINHDIDDAIRAKIITEYDLPKGPTDLLGHHHGARITTMVQDMVGFSHGAKEISMSPEIDRAMTDLRGWLFENLYLSGKAKEEEPKAARVVRMLFRHYMENPLDLPDEYREDEGGDLPQSVIDYVSGMTDRFALRTFERLFVPQAWMF